MVDSFKAITRPDQISKLVQSNIEDAIRSKRFATGTKLPSEHVLCRQFGVSRTAVREALSMLSAKGLVKAERGRGYYVREVTSDIVTTPLELFLHMAGQNFTILHAVETRQIIEPSLAGWAATHRSAEDVRTLRADIDDLENCIGGHEALAALDVRFHLDIARASRNPIIPLLLDPLHRLLPTISRTVYATVAEAKSSAMHWHRRILEAIEREDVPGAFEAMTEHLHIALEHAKRVVLQTPAPHHDAQEEAP